MLASAQGGPASSVSYRGAFWPVVCRVSTLVLWVASAEPALAYLNVKELEALHGVLDTRLLVGVGGRAIDRRLLSAHRA